jgi:FixJ family two-component response regulator
MIEPVNITIIDDEPALLKALTRLLKTEGFAVRCHESAASFLSAPRPKSPGCIVLDESMPGMTGMQLQQKLNAEGSSLAVIFLTAHGNIPMSVRAIKAGAADFLTKPVKDHELLDTIRAGLHKSKELAARAEELAAIQKRYLSLSSREREVMQHVVKGLPNKQIASILGLVEQTIKVHRSRAMVKMGAESLAQLVLSAEKLGLTSPEAEAI